MIELETEIDDAIRKDASLLPVVEQATTLLAEAVRHTIDPVSAHWQLLVTDQQIPTIQLKVEQGEASATIEFPRERLLKLTDSALDLTLIRLWGDLLQEKSHAQLARLRQLVENM